MPPLKPLPEVEGPRLEPFTQDITAHDLELLAVIYNDSAAHSLITRVEIDGREYCLKLVSIPIYNLLFCGTEASLIDSFILVTGLLSYPRSGTIMIGVIQPC